LHLLGHGRAIDRRPAAALASRRSQATEVAFQPCTRHRSSLWSLVDTEDADNDR